MENLHEVDTGEKVEAEVAEEIEEKKPASKRPKTTKKDDSKKKVVKTPANEAAPEVTEELEFVLPGDRIGTNEEFVAGSETFVSGGNIYSLVAGTVSVNKKRRTISVIPKPVTPPVIKEGDIVVGAIFNLRDSMVLLRIEAIQGKGERAFQTPVAAIHVSNVKNAYVKEMSNEFGMSDIVKGKVIDLGNMRLTTSGPELGVLKALCPVCHSPMKKDQGKDKLKCVSCGIIKHRKIAAGYGTGII